MWRVRSHLLLLVYIMLINVLLIEDDPDFAGLVKWYLSSSNTPIRFELHWEESLAGALAYLSTSHPDIMIVDLGLPDSSGSETVAKLVTVCGDTPFFTLSSEDGDATMFDVIDFGAEDHLIKSKISRPTLISGVLNSIARNFERQEQLSAA